MTPGEFLVQTRNPIVLSFLNSIKNGPCLLASCAGPTTISRRKRAHQRQFWKDYGKSELTHFTTIKDSTVINDAMTTKAFLSHTIWSTLIIFQKKMTPGFPSQCSKSELSFSKCPHLPNDGPKYGLFLALYIFHTFLKRKFCWSFVQANRTGYDEEAISPIQLLETGAGNINSERIG